MPRKTALLVAALLMGVIVTAILLLPDLPDVQADDESLFEPPNDETGSTSDMPPAGFESALSKREAALRANLAQREEVLESLDKSYSDQFEALNRRLEDINGELSAAAGRVEDLQQQLQNIQDAIAAADASFQEEMVGLQNNLSYQDAQLRQEIETVYAQLQYSYDQIADMEAQASSSADGGSSSSSHVTGSDDDHDEHEDHDDHQDGDHEEHEDDD